MKKLLALFVFVTCMSAAYAQEPGMTPDPELKKLEWQIGLWAGTLKMVMPGMEGDAAMSFKIEWDGNFLKTSSVMEMPGMKLTEVSYLGWDAAKKEYVSWTFTNFGALPRVERGKLQGDKVVLISDPWDTGMMKGMISRGTVTKKSNNEMALLIEFKQDKVYAKFAEGNFKRK